MERDISYEQMSKGSKIYEDSEVPCHNPPMQNEYEKKIGGSNGFDQSGFSNKKG